MLQFLTLNFVWKVMKCVRWTRC